MATILSFDPSMRSRKARQSPSGGQATIIIFTGVQYERIQDDEPGYEPDTPQQRKR